MTDILCKELRDSGLSVKDNEMQYSVDRCIEEMDAAAHGYVSEFTPTTARGYILCKSIVAHLKRLELMDTAMKEVKE